MIIRVDDDNNIVEAATIGGDKDEQNSYEVENVPIDILTDIFSYKYINGQFVKRTGTDEKHVQQAKEQKIKFLNETCARVIEAGIDVGDEHYSLTYADQINLSKLASQAAMYPTLPIFYHADGELCRSYTPEEILYIAQIAVAWVTYHTTYFNFAKAYINTLTSFDVVAYFKYGQSLSPELEEQLEAILETTGITYSELIDDPFNYDSILHPDRELIDNNLFNNMNPFYIPTPPGVNPV